MRTKDKIVKQVFQHLEWLSGRLNDGIKVVYLLDKCKKEIELEGTISPNALKDLTDMEKEASEVLCHYSKHMAHLRYWLNRARIGYNS